MAYIVLLVHHPQHESGGEPCQGSLLRFDFRGPDPLERALHGELLFSGVNYRLGHLFKVVPEWSTEQKEYIRWWFFNQNP